MKLLGLNRVELLVNDGKAAIDVFDDLFNGATFRKEMDGDIPVHSWMNWAHGLELVEPRDPEHSMQKLLDTKGEHVFTVVFDVERIDDAREHCRSRGFDIVYDRDFGPHDDFAVHKQICVSSKRTHGLQVMLQELKRA